MAEMGLFRGKRVELIEGQVIVMSPMGSPHATAVALAAHRLEAAFGPGYFARWQMPFVVSNTSEPEPDVALVQGSVRDYTNQHPTSAVLIVEVADTSLSYDRETKGSLYAKGGIQDYWIINLVDDQLEVYRNPVADPDALYGMRYASSQILREHDQIAPLALPRVHIFVADILL